MLLLPAEADRCAEVVEVGWILSLVLFPELSEEVGVVDVCIRATVMIGHIR